MQIQYNPIGIIHTPFQLLESMPIQPTCKTSAAGTVEIYPQFADGLKDLDGFSHIILLYHLHAVKRVSLQVTPFLDGAPHGVFATRAPTRPNPIGLSVVRLVEIKENILVVENIDILDGTPLLNIKPYVPEFDHHPDVKIGWLEKSKDTIASKVSDNRFQ
ncbi:MAG: tRNA (N6-threonylcarbamoyladenosine(37)-N6)-methyltransferase TrmO [Anaerolineales bacterium]|nr:tRNA (N6-threonylcarbamoyladenosine(37)-N6)-methyltransferase TrmO [Anaerolineales bacterium]